MPFSLFIIEDEFTTRKAIYYQLSKDYSVKEFASAEPALAVLAKDCPDLVLLDIELPGISGIDALKRIKAIDPKILVIMSTANSDIDTVISAMKMGAHDYVVKPVSMERLAMSIENALATIKMSKEIRSLQQRYLRENLPGFICESNRMQEVMQVVSRVARSQAPILIVGDSGTGKELIANTIHYQSPNFRGPFIAINCAAIPDTLIESELFGYEKGAFSGAAASGKKGQVELAASGTLFLDEIAEMSQQAQAKLLRFLEQGEFYRVGGCKKLHIQTRLISATNRNLERMINAGFFRDDLYYRLAIVKIEIPSLNERPEDILPIARHFLLQLGEKYGKNFQDISGDTQKFLQNRHWKGNIRELRNIIEKGVILGAGPLLTLKDLGEEGRHHGTEKVSPGRADDYFPPLPAGGIDLAALEKYYIEEALRRSSGNDAEAARLLRMNYYAFRYRRKRIYLGR